MKNIEKFAHELSRKYARQYRHNDCELTENHELVFSNEEIEDACLEIGRKMYWNGRKAFCKATCGETCPLLVDDIEGGGGLAVNCNKLKTFVETYKTL